MSENEKSVHRLSRGRPRSDPDIRKVQILHAARQLFIEVGFGEATMEIVASRCAISKATLYAVFSSKRDLFEAVMESAVRLEFPEDDIAAGSVAKALEAILLPASDDSDTRLDDRNALLQILFREAHDHPQLWSIYRATILREAQTLTEWLLEQQSQGRLVVDDAAMIAQMLINLALGYSPNQADLTTGPMTPIPYRREFITIFCRGIAPG